MTQEEAKTQKPMMTFRLDADVSGMLHLALKATTGKPVHGMKSHFGNEALRQYLPKFIKAKSRP